MELTPSSNEQTRCCPCLSWIPICILKESCWQGLRSAIPCIVYGWKGTKRMFDSLWRSSAVIHLPFSEHKTSREPIGPGSGASVFCRRFKENHWDWLTSTAAPLCSLISQRSLSAVSETDWCSEGPNTVYSLPVVCSSSHYESSTKCRF